MPAYVVKEATHKKAVEGQHGPMQVINLVLQEYGKQETTVAEWFTKATTMVPVPGSQLEGEIQPGQYGPRFKKAPPQGGFGGRGGGRSPEEQKTITRQHSQHMALLYVQAKAALGQLPDDFKPKDMAPIIDWFDRDAFEGWKK